MRTIKEKLLEHKQSFKRIQAPSELEGRLRNALQKVPAKPRKRIKLCYGLHQLLQHSF